MSYSRVGGFCAGHSAIQLFLDGVQIAYAHAHEEVVSIIASKRIIANETWLFMVPPDTKR